MVFTMSKGSLFQMTPSFHVFLAANGTSKPDFVLKGDFLEHNYSILYRGVPIAEVSNRILLSTLGSSLFKYLRLLKSGTFMYL